MAASKSHEEEVFNLPKSVSSDLITRDGSMFSDTHTHI